MIIISLTIKDTCYDLIINDFLSTKRVQFEKFPLECYGCNGEDCPIGTIEDEDKCEGYGTPLLKVNINIQRHPLI